MAGSPDDGKVEEAKIVVVGDGGCGKTSMLIRFCRDEFPTSYIPTVFDTESTEVHVDGRRITLKLWDTAGQEEFDALRRLSYPDTNVCIVCFSIDSPDSTTNVHEKWVPEVHAHCSPSLPILLVGCKSDSRQDDRVVGDLRLIGEAPVTTEQGNELAKRIGAVDYIECSALTCEKQLIVGENRWEDKNPLTNPTGYPTSVRVLRPLRSAQQQPKSDENSQKLKQTL